MEKKIRNSRLKSRNFRKFWCRALKTWDMIDHNWLLLGFVSYFSDFRCFGCFYRFKDLEYWEIGEAGKFIIITTEKNLSEVIEYGDSENRKIKPVNDRKTDNCRFSMKKSSDLSNICKIRGLQYKGSEKRIFNWEIVKSFREQQRYHVRKFQKSKNQSDK